MRETSFIDQNKDKWREFEEVLDGRYKDPDKLNDLFVHITDDLSFSRTFYPNRSVRVYLNGLAQRVFFSVYRNRKSNAGRLLGFWTEELPRLIHEARADFRLSFWVFALTMGIGMLSCAMDPGFAEVIMGPDYMEMTRANIESGDPMAVYKQKGQFSMALGITMNNLYVSFLTFALGVVFSLGSLIMIARTGFMVGAFQYFFIEQGLFRESFLTIWTHGTLEISAVIIAGAAGITMGRGLVFPGTYTRLQSFQRSARRGIKMMVGIAPIIVIAGFIEGYLTRFTETPDALRAVFIVVCLAFVLVYFVWYPRFRAAFGLAGPPQETKIPPDAHQRIDYQAVRSSGEIFSTVFIFLKRHFSRMALIALAAAAVYATLVFLTAGRPPAEVFYYRAGALQILSEINPLLTGTASWAAFLVNALTFGTMAFCLFQWLEKDENPNLRVLFSRRWRNFGKALTGGLILSLILYTASWYTFLLVFFGFGVILLWMFVNHHEGKNPAEGLIRALQLLNGTYGRALSLLALLLLTGLVFASLADTGLAWFFFELIGWIVNFEQAVMDDISVVVITLLYTFLLYLVMGMTFTGFGLLYYTLLEIREAPALRERISRIGISQQIRGLDRE